MKDNTLTSRLWFRLFLKVAVVFLSLVLFIMVCNTLFLDDYYVHRQKVQLIENRVRIEALDLSDKNVKCNGIYPLQYYVGLKARFSTAG